MDPTLLASGAVTVLVTFLKAMADKSVELGGEAAGEAMVERLKRIYRVIKDKLSKSEVDAEVLARLETDPASTARQRALEGVLAEVLERDPAFAAEVARLLKDAEPAAARLTVSDSGAVAGRDVRQRGRYVAGRDLTVEAPPQG